MYRFPVKTSAGMLLALLGGMASSSALAVSVPARGPIPFAAFDKDGNGSVSADEFNTVHAERMAARAAEGRPMRGAANAPSFTDFDSNGDGQLTPAELSAGQQAHMKKQRMMMKEKAGRTNQGMGMGRNMPAFTDFDLNGDGKVVAEEFDEARAKRIAERAQQGYQMKNLAHAPTFVQLDTNKDGAINPEEFAAHKAQRLQQKSP